MSEATKWPTLGDKVQSWDAVCDRCGEKLPADTLIRAVWSPRLFYVACRCSPKQWMAMEVDSP
jgi:hypothetical protein